MNIRLTLHFRVFSFLLLTVCHGMLCAQDEKKFQLYTANDGLSDNNISSIAQDNYGYLWIGSLRGLNRYDGRHFVQYHADKSCTSLPDETVMQLQWLDKKRLAAYTSLGLHIINTENGDTRDIIIPAQDPKYTYKFNYILCVLGDQRGNVYILTRSGFYQYDTSYRLTFRYDYYNKEQVQTEYFAYGSIMFRMSANEILIIAIDGAHIYNTETKKMSDIEKGHPFLSELALQPHYDYFIRELDPGNFLYIKNGSDSMVYINSKLKKKTISRATAGFHSELSWRTRIFKQNDSLFYLTSGQNGFFKLHLNTATDKIIVDTERYFPGYLCNSFIVDKNNRTWVATNTGLLKEMNNPVSVKQVSIPSDILKQMPGMVVRQLLCYGNKLYAGCVGDGGLLVFDKKSLSFLHRISFKKYRSSFDVVYSLIQAREDTVFIGSQGKLFWLKASTDETGEISLPDWDEMHNWVAYQLKDSRGRIWVGSNDIAKVYVLDAGANSFRRLNYDSGLTKKLIFANYIKEDREGNIWISGHGVLRINPFSYKADRYIDSFPSIRFGRREISTMAFDKNNFLWLGILNNGLAPYNPATGSFSHFTMTDGLPDNFIRSIYPLDNKIWIATSTGMASMDMRTHVISKFSGDDGFSSSSLSSTDLFFDSAAHYMYSGFTTNIVRFDPDSLLYAKSPPSFFIESVHFLNDTTYYYPGETIIAPYNKNDFTVAVSSVNFNDVNNQRIAYRIANSDDISWQPLSDNQINFNNLPPGTYRLQVKLFAANNRWRDQIKELDITINPPFWKATWFVALAELLLFLLVYGIYRWKVSTVKRRERAKVQVQELKAEEYKYQLELEKISHYFSSLLAGKKSIDEVLWGVAGKLIGEMGYEDCMIYLWNEDKTKMQQRAGYGPKGTPEALSRHVFEVEPGQGIVGHVIQTKKPILIGDTRKDNRYRLDEMFRLSEICVPIIHNGNLLGVIDSEHPSLNYFKARDLKLLTTIATLLGNKMKQMEFETSLAEKREELATINEQLAEARLTALQTQMNPHFIFNALNSIKRMILDNENRNASKYLSKFAQMIRMTLNHSKETFVTLQETIEYLHAYLGMEQLRFGSSFSYKIETIGELDGEDINIPTLMIQPLAENAIWHGLMHKEGDKRIMIRFVQIDETVTCTIEDNGIGFKQSEKMKTSANKRPHVGLDNLRKRIKIMNTKYDMNFTLDIIDLSEKNICQTGTLVILKFKMLTN